MQGVFCYPSCVNTKPHKLTDIDEDLRIAYCYGCDNLVKLQRSNSTEAAKTIWRCANKHKATLENKYKPYKVHKKDACENPDCTATIISDRQLSVDHIDGNHDNNDPANLKTLCLNCHAYKTYMNGDFSKRLS